MVREAEGLLLKSEAGGLLFAEISAKQSADHSETKKVFEQIASIMLEQGLYQH